MDIQIIATFSDKDTALLAIRKLKDRYPVIDAQVVNRTENELSSDTPPLFPEMQNNFFPQDSSHSSSQTQNCDICAEIYMQEGYEGKAVQFLKDCGAYDVTVS